MIILKNPVKRKLNSPYFMLLCSDLHLGSPNSDHDYIARQFKEAQDFDADILINGDIFDAINIKDKRYDADTLHPKLRGKKDLLKAIVDLGVDVLKPFAKNIKWIGYGNHCEAWTKHCGSDPIRCLLDVLSRENCQAQHAGFRGFVITGFGVEGYSKQPLHRLKYYHGTGGDSAITKGTTQFYRVARSWHADAITFGHAHNIACVRESVGEVTDGGKYIEREQLLIQTGSYFRNYSQLDDKTVLNHSYASSRGHSPKPIGGQFLILRPVLDHKTKELKVEQNFCSSVSPFLSLSNVG